jgi:glycine/D-amino acid oxidase-like deaminating enzyme
LSHDPAHPLELLVLGGGTAGWMTASLFSRLLAAHPVRISVLESPEIGIVGVGEGSTPQLRHFFDLLGIAEADWMPRCNATYKTAIQSRGWSTRPGASSYYHPFKTDLDDRSAPAFFYNTVMRRRGADVDAHPDRWFLDAVLAERALAPLEPESFPFRAYYGYHFDAYLIGAFLRDWAKARGVTHLEGTVARVEQHADGDLAAVHTDDGRRVAADFFVDCTGFRSLLLQQTLGVPFVPFAENLFNDAAVAMPTPHDERPIRPQTTATALSAGWAWRIPLTNRIGNGYVYSSRHLSKDQAEAELRAHLGAAAGDPPARHLRMNVGRVAAPWTRNCLAVGLSQGFIEPLEATALHLVQETLERFIDAWTVDRFGPAQRDAFNAEINGRFEGVRDYIVCRYKASSRTDTDYWRDATGHDRLSDSLRRILHCWMSGDDLVREIEDQGIGRYFGVMSWHCLLGGYGLYPRPEQLRRPDAREARFDPAKVGEFLRRCALNFPAHEAVLARHGAALPL